jgi:acyl carrier protein
MRIEDQLKVIVCDRMSLDIPPEDIADEQPLFEGAPGSLGLDSVEALELVVGIEETFGVQVLAEEDIAERFFSVSTLYDLVRDLIQTQQGQTSP